MQINVRSGRDMPHCGCARRIDLAMLAVERAAVHCLGKVDDRIRLPCPSLEPIRTDEAEAATSTTQCSKRTVVRLHRTQL
jgi:hypothetical protein